MYLLKSQASLNHSDLVPKVKVSLNSCEWDKSRMWLFRTFKLIPFMYLLGE